MAWTETVPQSEVRLAIPADSLRQLPSGASYNGHSGQARVRVSVSHDTLRVYATCDSLQVRAAYYESTSALWRERYEELAGQYETEIKQRPNPVRTFFCGFGIGILVNVLITLYIQKQKEDGK